MSIPGMDTPDAVEAALGVDTFMMLNGIAVVFEAAIMSMTDIVVSPKGPGMTSRENLMNDYVGGGLLMEVRFSSKAGRVVI